MSVGQVSGLVSGLDTKSLIDALVKARSRPILLLQQRQAKKTAELTAWRSFETILVSLKIAADRLADGSLWDRLAVRTSTADHLSVEAGTRAPTGSWDFFVERLAVAHQTESQSYASRDALVGAGTLVLGTAGGTREIAVDAGTTLAELAGLVNDADAGVRASIVRSTAAGVESFRLVLTAAESGEANRFTVDATGLTGGTPPAFTTSRTGEDAVLRFGGEGGTELRSSTNVFADVVEGLDVTVRKAHAAGEVTTVTVEHDVAGLENAVGQLVESYNAMIEFANGQFKFDPATGTRPPLLGSGTLTAMVGDMRSRVLGPVAGAESARFRTLLGAGLRAGADGGLTLNATAFREALATDYAAVANLFRVRAAPSGDGVTWLTAPAATALGGRTVRVEVTTPATRATLAGGLVDPGAGIAIDGTNDSFRISVDGLHSETLRLAHGTYTSGDALAAAIAKAIEDSENLGAVAVGVTFEPDAGTTGRLVLTSPRWGSKGTFTLLGTGSGFAAATGLTAVMNVRAEGVDVAGTVDGIAATGDGRRLTVPPDAGELAGLVFHVTRDEAGIVDLTFTEGIGRAAGRRLAELTDATDGVLRRLGDSIESIVDRYAKDILAKQEQLEQRRARLERQYARLESTLAELTGQGQFIMAQIESMRGGFGIGRSR